MKRKKQEHEMLCCVPGCGRPEEIKKLHLCKRCYAFARYWEYRSLEDRMNHAHKLTYWRERATFLFVHPDPKMREVMDSKRRK